ncbi:MAG TPA: cytochrome c [Chitinophagaceae bacterium]|nr:cytochrome c [Chitinophagaceae bacterium]
MKKFKKVLKWIGLVLLVLAAAISLTVMARQDVKYDAPYPDIKASTDSAVIARGKHLVFSSAHCINCHSRKNPDSLLRLGLEVPLTGGVLFDLPLGKIYSKNITPDTETGIGRFSDAEIARALRYGVHPDGTVVYDFMPFHNTSDEDLTAIISYLRSQKPIRNEVPGNKLNVLGKIVKAFMVTPVGPQGGVPKSVTRDTTAAYGKYLALSVAECSGCHTKRNLAGAYTGEPFGGGANIEGFISVNLTPDSSGRIFNWSKQNFIERFRMGKLYPNTPMPWNSFKRMTDEELTAIYNYLKTLKPVKTQKLN